jgi:hypothetical protein
MLLEQLPLAKQVEIVFRELRDELGQLSSGTVFIQIRNNVVGKFGIKHFPIESKDGVVRNEPGCGLTEIHQRAFRQLAIEALKHKQHWTHGEISFEFALMQQRLCTSIQFESNYNMANLLARK